jgi:osmoprotectant transport system ATP-binding protein
VAYVAFESVRKTFGSVVALDDVSFTVNSGEVVVLLGPSGCGKSTALQMVNRMLEPDGGRVLLDGLDVQEQDPVSLRRGIGYVIQQIGLFPHLTVASNIATVCRLQGWSKDRTAARVEELLDMVGLPAAEYGARYPHQLSGGQQQRVGVARALAASPPLLLMDEPFGALDPEIRRELQAEFRSWVTRLGTTVLFVSHDVDEAISLADRLIVFDGRGGIAQIDDPLNVLTHPVDTQVRNYLGPDRPLTRLGVLPLTREAWAPMATMTGVNPAICTEPVMVREALLYLLQADYDSLIMRDDQGADLGWLDLAALLHQPAVPTPPLKGPTTLDVIQSP